MSNSHSFFSGYCKKGRSKSQINTGRERALRGQVWKCLFFFKEGKLKKGNQSQARSPEGAAWLTKALGPAIHNDSRVSGMKLHISRVLWGN